MLGANGPAVVRPVAREVERFGAYSGILVLPLPGHDYSVVPTRKPQPLSRRP